MEVGLEGDSGKAGEERREGEAARGRLYGSNLSS